MSKDETPAGSAGEPLPPERVAVRVTHEQGHIHQGERHGHNAVIEVPAHDAAYIVAHGIGERVKGSK